MEKATFSHDIASQVLYPLLTASMETALNHVLYQENVLNLPAIVLRAKCWRFLSMSFLVPST